MTDSPGHNDGKRFEDAVAESLALAGWRIEREQLIGHKKVDIVAREVRWGKEWTTLVECKDYMKPLSRQEVVKIWADYQPLIDQGHAHELLIVTARGLAPSAVTYVNERGQLQAQILADILATSIDFSNYVANMADLFKTSEDKISQYYVEPRTAADGNLETIVRDWIGDKAGHKIDTPLATQPIAVLGAYGIGKSSFATYLSSTLATAALDNPRRRIPILIRLGDIAGEQTLEGLLGKHFTATYNVKGYSFNTFMALNRAGRFVVILDGFDEMKQLLTWREFRYNLRQLNRLQAENSRLIILGRPTAFETDEQHQLALHGVRTSRLGIVSEPGFPDYFEIELAQLTEDEMRYFLERYLIAQGKEQAETHELMAQLWSYVISRQLKDIARRPVQLRMLAEILPTYDGGLEQLNLVRIYDIFITHLIDEVIKREEEKQARLAFSSRQRRQFLTNLAFWLWQNQGLSVIEAEMIPAELVDPYVGGNDSESVRRDLVIGSPLDRRAGERLRFPHRSFQEFLVAEAIWARLEEGALSLAAAEPLVTTEVANFMRLQQGRSEAATARRLLRSQEGSLPWRVVNAVFMDQSIVESIHDKIHAIKPADRTSTKYSKPRPWDLLLLTIWNAEPSRPTFPLTPSDWIHTARADGSEQIILLCLFCLLFLGSSNSWNMESEVPELLEMMISRGGEVQRYTKATVRTSGLVPLGNHYIGRRDVRMGRRTGIVRVGEQVGRRGQLITDKGSVAIKGADFVEVRWLPDATVDMVQRLQFMRANRRIDLRGLRSVFSRFLPSAAFINDWVSGETLDNSVQLVDVLEFAAPQDALAGKVATIRRFYVSLAEAPA